MKYLKLLNEHNILLSLNLGREKLFINRRLLDLLISETHSFQKF